MEVAERLLGSIDTNDLAEIVRAIGTRDVASMLPLDGGVRGNGCGSGAVRARFAEHMRNMYVLSLAGRRGARGEGNQCGASLRASCRCSGPDRLARLLGVLGDLSAELKTPTNPRLSFEIRAHSAWCGPIPT